MNTSIVDVHGHHLMLNPDDRVLSVQLTRNRVWEPFETDVIAAEVRRGECAIDIGANIGYHTLLLAKLVGPDGQVFAFEPDPVNFDLLEMNVRMNGYQNVVAIRKAVAEETGPLILHRSQDNMGDHRIYSSPDEDRVAVPVEGVRLDDYFRNYPDRIDFLKMDIQGAELAALRGMRSVLERHRGVRILTEFWPVGLVQCGFEPEAYPRELDAQGFALYRLIEWEIRLERTRIPPLMQTLADGRYANLLCIRNGVVNLDVNRWSRRSPWVEQVYQANAEISALLPTDASFILVNDDQWWTQDVMSSHTAMPFLERNGRYWGSPTDDGMAIEEFERLRQRGASFMIFAWPAFWWLEHYPGFAHYLRSRFPCVLANDRLTAFDLRGVTSPMSA